MNRVDRIFLAATFVVAGLWCALICAPARAQEPAPTAPEVIAISAEDAETCKTGGCKLITPEVLKQITALMQRAAIIEELAARQAAELKKKPVRTYCI